LLLNLGHEVQYNAQRISRPLPPLDRAAGCDAGIKYMTQKIISLNCAQPRYSQVKSHLLKLISDGELKPNDRVPSENELVAALGVSRMTVNRALRELADEGLVVRLAGVGTFVADSRPHSNVMRVRNIADEIRARGHVHSAEVITLEEVTANTRLAERLEVRPGDTLFHSVILHLESGQPIQVEDRYVCPRLAPDYLDMDFTTITPNVYLTKVAPLHTAEHVIRARHPTRQVQRLLDIGEREPCLVIYRRTWTNGRPVSLAELIHPGSTYELIGTMSD
jgi:GntR family histidine utilization transcriptional repressor